MMMDIFTTIRNQHRVMEMIHPPPPVRRTFARNGFEELLAQFLNLAESFGIGAVGVLPGL